MSRTVSSKSSADIYENYFESNYPPLPLPMIWRVVYHEAVRGNHILWDRADLDAIEAHHQSPSFKMDTADRNAITKFMSRFFSVSDYRELQTMIRDLPLQHKAVAFVLYRRAITVWQNWLKLNLH